MKREDGTTERPVSELIDTLWNVNYHLILLGTNDLRINRYIMECKFY